MLLNPVTVVEEVDTEAAIRELTAELRDATRVRWVTNNVPFPVTQWQKDFLDADEKIVAAVGGIGSGKTFAAALYIADKMKKERGRGTVGAIFANTYEQLSQATLPKLWEVFQMLGMEEGTDYVYNKEPPRDWPEFRSKFKKHNNVLSVRAWGQAVTRSLQKFEAIRGIELGWAVMDEARDTDPMAFAVVLGRLRCPRCTAIQLRITTSPNGYDWLWEEFVEKQDDARRLIHMATNENLFLDPDYYNTLLKSYDPRFAQQELQGLFIHMTSGLVYHQFDRNANCAPVEFDPSQPLWPCFDFNRNPMSCAIAQRVTVDGVECVHVIDEISVAESGTKEVCQELLTRYPPSMVREVWVHGDPAGKYGDTRGNRSDYDIIRAELQHPDAYGTKFHRAWKDAHPPVIGRINAMNAMLHNALGQRRLIINPRCKVLIRDLERVSFKEGTKQIDKTTDKQLTHMSDALGYLIADKYRVRRGPAAGRVNI
jgi:phage terminase large subunit